MRYSYVTASIAVMAATIPSISVACIYPTILKPFAGESEAEFKERSDFEYQKKILLEQQNAALQRIYNEKSYWDTASRIVIYRYDDSEAENIKEHDRKAAERAAENKKNRPDNQLPMIAPLPRNRPGTDVTFTLTPQKALRGTLPAEKLKLSYGYRRVSCGLELTGWLHTGKPNAYYVAMFGGPPAYPYEIMLGIYGWDTGTDPRTKAAISDFMLKVEDD